MESDDTAAALRDAELARDELAGSVVFPRGHDLAIGAAVAVQIATSALGLYVDEPWARWALAGGLVLFGLVAALQLWRFVRLNGVRIRGFPVELDRALDNLMTNAVRYGRDPASGKLAITVALKVAADRAVVSVTDQGPGVSAEEVDRLMRPFERGEAARSGSTGAGLGLPIVERVARMHGGDVQLSANSPHGLRVELRLPLSSR